MCWHQKWCVWQNTQNDILNVVLTKYKKYIIGSVLHRKSAKQYQANPKYNIQVRQTLFGIHQLIMFYSFRLWIIVAKWSVRNLTIYLWSISDILCLLSIALELYRLYSKSYILHTLTTTDVAVYPSTIHHTQARCTTAHSLSGFLSEQLCLLHLS